MPWVYIRREIARQWGVPPWVVDEHPDEAEVELRIRAIEGEAERWRGTR